MKKVMYLAMCLMAMTAMQSCSTTDDDNDVWGVYPPAGDAPGGNNMGGGMASDGNSELTTFTVSIDKDTAEPQTAVAEFFPDEEDNLDNNSFATEVKIVFSDGSASYDTTEGVTITANGAHVVADHGSAKGICYVVSGSTTNGSLTILGEKKYELKLNGADITNPDSAAVNLLSKKRAYIVLAEGTENRVADGSTPKGEAQKGAFYAKGKMLFNGTGRLEVYGNCNNGVHCADYIVLRRGSNIYVSSTANHGIKANDGIYVNGGILNVEVSATAAKGINCESNIVFNGGRTTIVTTGGGTFEDGEAKAAAAVKADSTITVNGGELWLKSTGAGGKGLKADWEIYLNGGSVYAITEGTKYSANGDTSSPKGIKAGTKNVHGVLEIAGASVMVRTNGQNGEGIESKGTLTVSDGTIQVLAYDDAVNSSGNMYVKGGSLTAIGQNSDGLDANGNMYISGGTIVAFGASGAETGIDVGEQYKLYISGGNIFGIGGRNDATLGNTTQGIISATASVSANSTVTVSDGSQTLATLQMPAFNYSSGTMMLSTEGMQAGSSYTVGLGSTTQTLSASSTLSSDMGGGMGGGGGGPGRR